MTLRRALGPFDATMVVIGGIIGSGIFINPYIVARTLDSSLLVLSAWIAGGVIALAGAFAYAELGGLFPKAGGQYVYLRDGWHPLAGFMYGWALLLVIESGAIAAVAITFATYALRLVGRPDIAAVPLAVASIVLLSVVNYFGVKPGSRVLNVLVVLKVAALAVLIAAAALSPSSDGWLSAVRTATPGSPGTVVAFGASMIPILFAYGGWQSANYLAEEIDRPEKNLPLSLVIGTAIVVLIYLLVNAVYLRALGLDGLARTVTPASRAAGMMFGDFGDRFVTAAIAISTFGFLDLGILAPTRVYYAMAADGLFLPALATAAPAVPIAVGCHHPAVSMVVRAGPDGTIRAIAQLRGVRGLDLLRPDGRDADRLPPPRAARATPAGGVPVSGYPIVPIAFCLVAAAVVASVVRADPVSAGRGAALLGAGVPVFFWFRGRA